ncbi:MAG: esterase [Lachnospiraceae bacterium]|nr:esterase [Lachnospiraceae bacterium]
MKKETCDIGGRKCVIFSTDPSPAKRPYLLLQPAGEHEGSSLNAQADMIAERSEKPFIFCCFSLNDWNQDLTPWSAPPVFGREPFGDGAAKTLEYIRKSLLPAFAYSECVIGGYSLAAFFALWCGYETDLFAGIASASPSVWYPGWMEYIAAHPFRARAAALSLGDREMKTRNQTMAKVGDCMQEQYRLFNETEGVMASFEWNSGNHFKDADLRTAKVFAQCLEML